MFLTKCQPVLSKQPRVQFGWDPCIDVSGNQITIELRQLVLGAAQSCLFIGPKGVKSPGASRSVGSSVGQQDVPVLLRPAPFPALSQLSLYWTASQE